MFSDEFLISLHFEDVVVFLGLVGDGVELNLHLGQLTAENSREKGRERGEGAYRACERCMIVIVRLWLHSVGD